MIQSNTFNPAPQTQSLVFSTPEGRDVTMTRNEDGSWQFSVDGYSVSFDQDAKQALAAIYQGEN